MGTAAREVLGDRFYDLLEAGAEEACRSVHLLAGFLKVRGGSTEDLAAVRQKSERLAAEISETLVKTIMASLQRDDIQGLSGVLRTIPKRVEGFAERFNLAEDRGACLEFSRPVELLEPAVDTLVAMVEQLRVFANLARTQELSARLEEATDEAETLLEGLVRDLYRCPDDPLRVVIAKDLSDQIQSILDACRDGRNRVHQVALKYL